MEDKPHSGLGIVSFIIGVVSAVLIILVFAVAVVLHVITPGGTNENSTEAAVLGYSIFATLGMTFLGLGFGIGSLLQKTHRKTFGILGVIFSGSSAVLLTIMIVLTFFETT